ncbi:MAG TPA: LysM domain-containing protein [Bacteroidia bacterium]|nr:LysM domain-containing protein [Bacteroidia bacterium]HOZ90677.1 LysM domain-containing protein [Bacteroidia bacterium]HRB52107.1 LysM domain-containing protein [Bacteroidia bacterium]
MAGLYLHDFDLYSNGRIIVLPSGNKLLKRDKIKYSPQEPDIYHTVVAGDTLTFLAWKFYSRFTSDAPKYWKYIADVNNIKNPLDIRQYIGKNIVIPNFALIKLSE